MYKSIVPVFGHSLPMPSVICYCCLGSLNILQATSCCAAVIFAPGSCLVSSSEPYPKHNYVRTHSCSAAHSGHMSYLREDRTLFKDALYFRGVEPMALVELQLPSATVSIARGQGG